MSGKLLWRHTQTGLMQTTSSRASAKASELDFVGVISLSEYALHHTSTTSHIRVHCEWARQGSHVGPFPIVLEEPVPCEQVRSTSEGSQHRQVSADYRLVFSPGGKCEWWHWPSSHITVLYHSGQCCTGGTTARHWVPSGQNGHRVGIPPHSGAPILQAVEWKGWILCSHLVSGLRQNFLMRWQTHWIGASSGPGSTSSSITWMTSLS